jgi:hypothetical protein
MSLILSTIALILGPIVYSIGQDYAIARRVFHGLVVLTIAVIIGFHIIPEAIKHGGSMAVVVIILGIAFPLLFERLFRKATDTAHLVIVAIAASGLLIHAIVDGVALLPESGTGLRHAIVLHRLPVGMALWWAVRPSYGVSITVTMFALIFLATAAGYFVGETIIEVAEAKTLAMLQAFVSGSLIHVVAFGVKHKHDHD